MSGSKTNLGNFFEDFSVGQVLQHATPRTLTVGDAALYMGALRLALRGAVLRGVRQGDRLPRTAPLDDLLVFHTVFGKTVPDISLNAVANLGYAECRFLAPVYPGDTLSAASEVIGLRENSNRDSGVVYVRTTGRNQAGEPVLEYVRWVMVRKRDNAAPAPDARRAEARRARRSRVAGRGRAEARCGALRLRARRLAAIAGATTRRARRSTTSTP